MKRNLLFHLYPRKGSIWRWHVDRLLEYQSAWNGRRIITVALDAGTETQAEVAAALAPLGAEIFWDLNSPALGETQSFVKRLGLLRSLDPDEATFYAHSKGVTHRDTYGPLQWAKAMYVLCLENVPAVERMLSLYSAVGCFRHFGHHAGSRWCYGGTFFWLKHSVIFSRNWSDIHMSRYGVEGYPGRHLRWGEMGTFTADNVGPDWLYSGGPSEVHIMAWKANWGTKMHGSVIKFLRANLKAEEVAGKHVLEVGSYNVNGSPRVVLEPLRPARYVGVDVEPGPCVDRVVRADDLGAVFGPSAFDVVISTEMLEHVRDWRRVVSELKRVVKPNGLLLVTTRSRGFPFHGYPEDNWRYSLADFSKIFADMGITVLELDPEAPGVFLKARKPAAFAEIPLAGIEVERAPAGPPIVARVSSGPVGTATTVGPRGVESRPQVATAPMLVPQQSSRPVGSQTVKGGPSVLPPGLGSVTGVPKG